jgi:hypothetical protein
LTWLYLIREGESGPIKIGRSNDPWKRMDTLQSGNPRQLFMICAFRVGTTAHIVERNTHREFIAHRMLGEWYAPVDQLVDFAAARGLPTCERCDSEQKRLHVWAPDKYHTDPIALCFACMNSAESEKIRIKEEEEAREKSAREARWAADAEAKREAGRRN